MTAIEGYRRSQVLREQFRELHTRVKATAMFTGDDTDVCSIPSKQMHASLIANGTASEQGTKVA